MRLFSRKNLPLYVILSIELCTILAISLAILYKNDGHFIYTLDDPYIFLALIKNHFTGVTPGIVANASSSLLGAYILPLFQSVFNTTFPFFLNITLCLINTLLFWRIINEQEALQIKSSTAIKTALLVLLVIATGQITLIFTGMEHSAQVLLCTIAFWGVMREQKHQTVSWWFLLSIILLPLWRYDCLAIYVPLLAYLYFRGYIKQAIIALCASSIVIIAYFSWWHTLGHPFFPTSLILKSISINQAHSWLTKNHITTAEFVTIALSGLFVATILLLFLKNAVSKYQSFICKAISLALLIFVNLSTAFYVKLLLSPMIAFTYLACFIYIFLPSKFTSKQLLALVIIAQITLEISFFPTLQLRSQMIFWGRFESHWYVFTLLGAITLFLTTPILKQIQTSLFRIVASTMSIIFVAFPTTLLLPIHSVLASNSIYRQQFQMARFVRDYYQAPVAVSDLGLVAYYSPSKVIDICGIGYPNALTDYKKQIQRFCSGHNLPGIVNNEQINLIITYRQNAPKIPNGFKIVGELITLPPYRAISRPNVYFLARENTYLRTLTLLQQFKMSLPKGDKLILAHIVKKPNN